MRQKVQANFIFLLTGVILIAIGGFILLFWPAIFKAILTKELVISEKSKGFSEWKNPSIELYFDVYLFNWTNADEFTFPDFQKPVFKELGPYRFREYRDKIDLKFFDHNSTVSYKPISTYIFDERASNGSLDDVVTNINMVAVGAASHALKLDYQKRKVISLALNGYEEEITVTKSVRELLFDGYEDDMVSMGRANLIEGFDISHIPYDKVGWFYMRNGTADLSGIHNVHTGKSDGSKLGTIQYYNGGDFSKMYKGKCSQVYGSAGELYPPEQKKESIDVFTPDMCRSIPFDFEEEVDVYGVLGYKFTASERLVDNGTKYPENECYFDGRNEFYPSGVFNISACRYSSPVFMSYPHFYGADEYFKRQVDGMEPSQERHESSVTLEPMSGVPLEVVMRFQANFLLKEVEDIALFQSVPTLFIPTMWVEQKYKISEALTGDIKLALVIPDIGRLVGLAIIALGLICVLITTLLRCLSRNNTASSDVNLPEMKSSNRRPNESSPALLNGDKIRGNIKIQKMDHSNK